MLEGKFLIISISSNIQAAYTNLIGDTGMCFASIITWNKREIIAEKRLHFQMKFLLSLMSPLLKASYCTSTRDCANLSFLTIIAFLHRSLL